METLAANWWGVMLRGVAAVAFGITALLAPGAALLGLLAVFSAYALVDGVVALITAIRGGDREKWWGALLIEGVLGVVIGVFTWTRPGVTARALLYTIAAFAIVRGVLEIAAAIRLRRHIEGEWLLGASGVFSLIFGALLFLQPDAGGLAIVLMIGVYALMFGIAAIVLGLRLRSFSRSSEVTGPAMPSPI